MLTKMDIAQKMHDAANELLTNIYDAEDHLHPETGEELHDVKALSDALYLWEHTGSMEGGA